MANIAKLRSLLRHLKRNAVPLWATIFGIYTVIIVVVLYNKITYEPPLPRSKLISVQSFSYLRNLFLSNSVDLKEGTTIVIGSGITSLGLGNVSSHKIAEKFVFYRKLVPTFCQTASFGFDYVFYLAYDNNDTFFNNANLRDAFAATFQHMTGKMCPPNFNVSLHFIRCDHNGKPAWAQNDAMIEAYLDGAEYFYRVNDDTQLETSGWTEAYIVALSKFQPPLVGVVGPVQSGAGESNVDILTYDFVHRTHIDIFGFYYPRDYGGWFADTWITDVYFPERSAKLEEIHLVHTADMGTRYNSMENLRQSVWTVVQREKQILNSYLASVMSRPTVSGVAEVSSKVISISLFRSQTRYTWGAIRNAQLVPVHLHGWTLHIYISTLPQFTIEKRILFRLQQLGAHIKVVPNQTARTLTPLQWRLLASEDLAVDYFLVRDVDWRLGVREAAVVRDWEYAEKSSAANSSIVHCIHDHVTHVEHGIVDGLWGAKSKSLRSRLKSPSLLDLATRTGSNFQDTLDQTIWPIVANATFCHGGIPICAKFRAANPRHNFVQRREGRVYVGLKYNEHEQADWPPFPNNHSIGYLC